jgi:hypothetical protein
MATFWHTFHHDGKLSPARCGWGVLPLSLYLPSQAKLWCTLQRHERADTLPLFLLYPCTVRTVAADLRRREHIPKMQTNIGRKSMLRVLRQLKSKDGAGGGGLGAVPYRAVPCRDTPRGIRPGAACPTSAVNLSQIEFGDFGSGRAKNTRMGSIRVPPDL